MLGKKIYRTSMVNFFRLIVLAITVFFFNDFYLEVLTHPKFAELAPSKTFAGRILGFLNFNYHYPQDLVTFVCLILVPFSYYAFFRGVKFFEKGMVVNKGLPFFTQTVPYEEIKSYKLFHPKFAISVHAKNGESFIIADNNVERVIAILDQHNIPGDLASEAFVGLINTTKKMVIFIVCFVFLLFVVRKLGLYFFSV